MTSIPHRLEQQIALLLAQHRPELSPPARRRLAWMLWAVLVCGTLVLRQIANTLANMAPSDANASSHERRLRRTIHDPRLSWHAVFAPLVRHLLRNLSGSVTVIVDESGHTDVLRVLTAALYDQGRAIPLAWISWQGQVPHQQSYWQDCATLLARASSVLSAHLTVTLVADRAFGCPAFLGLVSARGWQWVARVQGQTRLRQADGSEAAIKSMVSQSGQHWWGQGEVFKKQGWRRATMVAYWRAGCKEPLLLVSSLVLPMQSVRVYRWRSAIEAMFRDWKSYGFEWEASHVVRLAHQECLVVILALATVLTLLLGVEAAEEIVAQGAQQGKRRPWSARDSLFGLGRQRCVRRLWSGTKEALLDSFPTPPARPWFQVCWAAAAPQARMASVKDGQVCHHR